MAKALTFVVPGPLTTPTGGYVYDRQVVAGLRALGWAVKVEQLGDGFPQPGAAALADADARLAALADGALVMLDGLALGAMPDVAERHATRLRLIALVHHPLALETGLTPAEARRLEASERRALACVRRVIVTSARTAATLAGWAVPPAIIGVVEPAVEAPAVVPERQPGAVLELLCVATLTERKGHALLFDVLSDLSALPWSLRCVGSRERSPGTAADLEAKLRQLDLVQRVVLAGELPQAALSAAYAGADLLVLPTLYEGYGMVVAEALAHGLPVVATATGAIAELVPSDAGIVVAPGDGPALRAALAALLSDRPRLARLSAGARRAAAAARRWPQAAREMATLLDAVAA